MTEQMVPPQNQNKAYHSRGLLKLVARGEGTALPASDSEWRVVLTGGREEHGVETFLLSIQIQAHGTSVRPEFRSSGLSAESELRPPNSREAITKDQALAVGHSRILDGLYFFRLLNNQPNTGQPDQY